MDEDPGAVEIAKLRLWLSMVVDEEEITDIKPLPNLDYKIMQGNSLLEEFEGIRLFDEKALKGPDEERDQRIADLKEKCVPCKRRPFAPTAKESAAQRQNFRQNGTWSE